MDQKKTGSFLKELRKEKGITQEQLAELTGVSNRSVSRWETGTNMPDLDILIQLADYYEVELREILDGERKNEKMNKELEETVLKAADYTSTEASNNAKRVNRLSLVGVILWFVSQILSHTDLVEIYAVNAASEFMAGAGSGLIILGIIMTNCYGRKIRAFKSRLLKRL